MTRQLNPEEITNAVKKLGAGWRLEQGSLTKAFELPNFRDSIDFVVNLAERAEEMNHHPEISIRFNHVEITLITHAVAALTDLDFAFAERVDRIFSTMTELEAHPRRS
ncbi:MAG: 4a-hydroxytetrahydrobiopterin dehydratase [Acidimicrobiales bacterium]